MKDFFNKIISIIFDKRCLLFCGSLYIVLLCFWTLAYKTDMLFSDSGMYQYYALNAYKSGHLYPDMSNYHNSYVFAPGWVNILVLWLHCFGTLHNAQILLVLFNIINLVLIYLTTLEITGKKWHAYLAAYIYMSLPAFFTTAIFLYSDIPFLAFSSASFYLSFRKNWWCVILAGFFITIAFWIRPLAEGWIFASSVLYLFYHRNWKKCFAYLGMVFICIAVIAISTHKNFPDYVYKSTTGGVNLIMGANDRSIGTYSNDAFSEGGLGYLPGAFADSKLPVYVSSDAKEYLTPKSDRYTYLEYDSIYKSRAVDWILHNPIKWISQIPLKCKYMYWCGSFLSTPVENHINQANPIVVKLLSYWQLIILRFIFIFAIIGMFLRVWKSPKILSAYIPCIFVSCMTIACVVCTRYNFIIIPLCISLSIISAEKIWIYIVKIIKK